MKKLLYNEYSIIILYSLALIIFICIVMYQDTSGYKEIPNTLYKVNLNNIDSEALLSYNDKTVTNIERIKDTLYRSDLYIHNIDNTVDTTVYVNRTGNSSVFSAQPAFKITFDEPTQLPVFNTDYHYKHFVIRSTGNEYGRSFMRTPYSYALCKQNGFPNVPNTVPCELWISNKYYGHYWMVETLDRTYISQICGCNKEDVELLKGDSMIEVFYKKLEPFLELDLGDATNYAELQKVIDVHSFLEYCALQKLCGNLEPLSHDMKAYSINGSPYTCLIWDLDQTFNCDTFINKPVENIVKSDSNPTGQLFYKLVVENDECFEYFTQYVNTSLDTTFSYSNLTKVLNDMHTNRLPLLENTINCGVPCTKEKTPTTMSEVNRQLSLIDDWNKNLPTYMENFIQTIKDERK